MSNVSMYISSFELAELIKENKVAILDVRSLQEFEEGHIRNALLRPVDSLPSSIFHISKEQSIVTVCNSGVGRSEVAASLLQQNGWKSAKSLIGGYLGWVKAGFPSS